MYRRLRNYLAELTAGRLILWCYLIWYLVVLVRYFDPGPSLWITSLGLSLIIGTALVINANSSGRMEARTSTPSPGTPGEGWGEGDSEHQRRAKFEITLTPALSRSTGRGSQSLKAPTPALRQPLDLWPTFRFYLTPFCVSSFAALVKGKGFFLVFSPHVSELLIAVLLCGALCAAAAMARRGRRATSFPPNPTA